MSTTFLFLFVYTYIIYFLCRSGRRFFKTVSLSLPQLSEVLLSALNQNLVQFTLRPGVQVTVYAAHLSAGKTENISRLCVQPGAA